MYPRKSKLFQEWAKAMVAGATVDKPSYPGTSKSSSRAGKPKRRRRRKKKRTQNAKKD